MLAAMEILIGQFAPVPAASAAAPAKRRRKAKKLPIFLHPGEPDQLRACFRGKHARRDRLIALVELDAGLRVTETVHLRVEQVDLELELVEVRDGKGGRDRGQPLTQRLLQELAAWIGARTSGWLFPSPYDPERPLSARSVQRRIKAAALRAGIPRRVTPHKLRHTYITTLLDRGATVREAQELAGHANLATTSIYAHLIPGRLKRAVQLLDQE